MGGTLVSGRRVSSLRLHTSLPTSPQVLGVLLLGGLLAPRTPKSALGLGAVTETVQVFLV